MQIEIWVYLSEINGSFAGFKRSENPFILQVNLFVGILLRLNKMAAPVRVSLQSWSYQCFKFVFFRVRSRRYPAVRGVFCNFNCVTSFQFLFVWLNVRLVKTGKHIRGCCSFWLRCHRAAYSLFWWALQRNLPYCAALGSLHFWVFIMLAIYTKMEVSFFQGKIWLIKFCRSDACYQFITNF